MRPVQGQLPGSRDVLSKSRKLAKAKAARKLDHLSGVPAQIPVRVGDLQPLPFLQIIRERGRLFLCLSSPVKVFQKLPGHVGPQP